MRTYPVIKGSEALNLLDKALMSVQTLLHSGLAALFERFDY